MNNLKLYHMLHILINASYSKRSGYVSRYDEKDGELKNGLTCIP
ncbi:MAG: hypothetical protein ACE5KD_03265 [Candidatus Bathyarchaeia archaeon]